MRCLKPAMLLSASAVILCGQSPLKPLFFEVASIRENVNDDPFVDYVPRRSGDRVTMHNVDLKSLVSWAYGLANSNYQLVPGPGEKALLDSYDIEALAPSSPGSDDLRVMFQALLQDRFRLKVHRETRDLPAYDLVVARGGARLTTAEPGLKQSVGFGGSSSWVELNNGLHLLGKGASMEEMCVVLSGQLRAPVQDRTGLIGRFNYDLAFTRDASSSEAPFLTTAIQELGLNLKKRQRAVRGARDRSSRETLPKLTATGT